MAKVYVFLANGFEEVEALAPIDILRRGGVEVQTVSVMDTEWVTSAHGVTVKADARFDDCSHFEDADMLVMPGGMPGASNLNEHAGLRELLLSHHARGKRIGAICAAPMVLGNLGVLKGRQATCYPGFDKYLDGAEYTGQAVTVDGHFTTGKGPAAAFSFGFCLLAQLTSEDKAEEVRQGMLVNEIKELQ